jgi:hypothetical protein
MKRLTYSLLTVLLPIATGFLLYVLKDANFILIVRNYLPDALWAFSFTSAILIIWNGKINRFWIVMLFLIFVAFEFLQSIKIITGTGDLNDVICYYTFAILAFFIYKQTFKIQDYEKKP